MTVMGEGKVVIYLGSNPVMTGTLVDNLYYLDDILTIICYIQTILHVVVMLVVGGTVIVMISLN